MAFTAKNTGGGTNWEPVPMGVYSAVCYALVDLGNQENTMYGNVQHKCWVAWELPTERIEIELEDGSKENKPRVISKFFTVSLHEKSNLRQILESWRGKVFTKLELQGFDLSTILGANCQINVIHKVKQDNSIRSEIGAIMPLGSGQQRRESENKHIYFSIEEHGMEIPADVPDGIKAMIQKSYEWNQLGQQQHDPWEKPDTNFDNNQPPIEAYDDSDIPF